MKAMRAASGRKLYPSPAKSKTTVAQWSKAFRETKRDGWTPRRRGAVYCSPLCGAKCTHAAFTTAVRQSAALAKKLGKGWEPVVWENMGWHYSVKCGVAEMHVDTFQGKSCYTVYFNSATQFVAKGDTPFKALLTAIGVVRVTLGKINKDLQEIAA